MSDIKFTDSQRKAIENRGGALLVSAAAGSGKTRVLIERLLTRVTDERNPVDIDRFLVITYTKSAAAELRSKILDEISERIAREPENRHLRRQLSLVYKAPISTIHSFCGSILRENAHLLGISPEFRIMESDESEIVKLKVLEETLEGRYERADRDFLDLADTMGSGRDDSKLVQLALELHSKLKSHPYPERWAEELLKALDSCGGDAADTIWGRALIDYTKSETDYWLKAFGGALWEIYGDKTAEAAYSDSFAETYAALQRFREELSKGWDCARAALPVAFPRLKPLRGLSAPYIEKAKHTREQCKKAMARIADTFDSSSAELLEDIRAVMPSIRGLFSLVFDFDRAYSIEKSRCKTLDFSDLEHLAVSLLINEANGEPTKEALELSERFEEIMVDEYQDVNEIQDIIFRALSRGGRNLFMVGDVKQSIYRFRLADPSIFLRKYEAFSDADETGEGEPRKIILQDNFRSRVNVLDAVNFIFSNIMSKEFGEMDYTERESLRCGKTDYPESGDKAFELDLIDIPDSVEEEEEADKTEVEAAFVARRIRELVDGGMLISDKNGQRRLSYGDIAILLRSVKGKAEIYAAALRAENIPYSTNKGGEFWNKTEVSAMISLLAVIDNPRQDVPLISALRSPLFGFTPDDLAEIRAADKDSDFYTALKKTENKKCEMFIELLDELRLKALDMTSDALIWHIYCRTLALPVFGAMDGGSERKANLMALLDFARQFESAGYKGLFGFVNQIRKVMERGGESPVLSTQSAGNAVTLTSIHKSKGLEYPVVIIADTGKRFNKEDTRKQLLVHSELGVGPKRLDLVRRIEYTTLPRMAVARRITAEMLAEEMRVLYVAMTRAREKLIITCAFKNSARLIERLLPLSERPIAPQTLSDCDSMAEWIILAALLRKEASAFMGVDTARLADNGDSTWHIRHITPENLENHKNEDIKLDPADASEHYEVDVEEIARRLRFRYSFEAATRLPSKLTATGIKGRFLDREAAEEAERLEKPGQFVFDRPRFASEGAGLTGAERGIALHLVMQYIDYKKCTGIKEIEDEIKRLADLKIITGKQAEAVQPAKILEFFNSELGKAALSSKNMLREFKFSLLIPASDYFPDGGDEKIMLQGVVDCCYEEQDGLTIIDFKTDYVTKESQEERAKEYGPQISAYSKAMERITGKPVKRRVLYFFRTGDAVEV